MNKVAKGYDRDNSIVATVEELGALTTQQIYLLHFNDIKTGLRKAQERLGKLTNAGRLKRVRVEGQYVYFVHKPGLIEHTIDLNWVYIWLKSRLSAYQTMEWEREPDYEILRADALVSTFNKITTRYSFMFVELDRGFNRFDKIAKYNALYNSGKYAGKWWVKHTDSFPAILCVARTTERAELIHRTIVADNTHNLRFDVRVLSDIRGDARERLLANAV